MFYLKIQKRGDVKVSNVTCGYALSSAAIELPRIPAFYPKFIKFIATVFKFLLLDYLTAEKECFHIGLLFTCHFFVFLILYPPVQQIA